MTRLLGVKIAHGFTSEARVFATLLAERHARYEPCVLMHDSGDDGDVERFAEVAHAEVATLDTGWRPNLTGRRMAPGRLPVAVRFMGRIDDSVAYAERIAPDVVYSSQQHYDCRTTTRIADRLDVPQIIHLHYIIGPWLRRFVINRLRTADHVVAVSDFIRDQALNHGVEPGRVTTIRNTMTIAPPPDPALVAGLRTSLGVPADAFVYGMVSRLDPGKGHLDAIVAFQRTNPLASGARLVIVGTGRHEAQIKSAAAKSGVGHRIHFLGQRSDVPALLGMFDAFVHPATADPCPLSVLESMAASLPVVAYANGGVPELVVDGVSGYLAPHGDVGRLAALMALVRAEPELGRRLGEAAAARIVTDFEPARAGAAFADVVAGLVDARARASS